MVTPQLEVFYKRWLNKAHNYKVDCLTELYDKFITLYIIYNSLYIEVFNISQKSKKGFSEYRAATDNIIQYINSSFFIENLFYNEDLSAICQLIEQEKFYIIFEVNNNGIRQPLLEKDKDLLKRLKSRSKNSKAKAILELIYNIRCNLIHGGKGFEEEQSQLLIPVTHLLEKTIEIVYSKLKK